MSCRGLGRCADGSLNPRDVKIWLAKEIIARYHDEALPRRRTTTLIFQRFSKNAIPDEMPEVTVSAAPRELPGNLLKEPDWWTPLPRRCA